MNEFFDNWKSYKDDILLERAPTLLKEFTRQDKEELIAQGDDFTVSYEIEMISTSVKLEPNKKTNIINGKKVEEEDCSNFNYHLHRMLPNFWKKYGNDMDMVTDLSLPKNRNVEIKMKTYLKGINSALEFLNLFFKDFNGPDNYTFQFSNDTGLHTNISMDIPDKKFNVLKGLLFLSEEETKPGKVPYAYKGTESRYTDQSWTKPIKNKTFESVKHQISKLNKESKDQLLDAYKNNDFDFLSDYINEMVKRYAGSQYVKGFGFNSQYVDTRGYIEFRYPGHKLTKENLTNLTLYYAYIVKLTLDPNFKRDEYNSKLVKLLQDVLLLTDQPSYRDEAVKDYKVFLDYAKKYAWNFENERDLFRALVYAKSRFAYNTFYNFKDKYNNLYIERFDDFVEGWPAIKSDTGNDFIQNIIALDPSLKDKIIQRFSKYRNIPAYRYCVATLTKYKNSDVKLFTAALGTLESILNNVHHDIHNVDILHKLFTWNRNILPDILSEITDDLTNSFTNYYETHKDEFNYGDKTQQPVSESVFDKYENTFDELYEGRKLGKPSSETNLGDWFKRKGAPGKKGGWVDCNTCRDGKCKPCGRQEGESRSKYPRCRPTPSQCKGYKRRHSNLQKEVEEIGPSQPTRKQWLKNIGREED